MASILSFLAGCIFGLVILKVILFIGDRFGDIELNGFVCGSTCFCLFYQMVG